MTLLEQFIRAVLLESSHERLLDDETEEDQNDDTDRKDEFSGTGAVAGYSLPLGMDPEAPKASGSRRSKRMSPWKAASKSFGNAKLAK